MTTSQAAAPARVSFARFPGVELARRLLPTGGGLSPEMWNVRHRALTLLLWVHIPALGVFGILRGTPLPHLLGELSALSLLAALASSSTFSPALRSVLATIGLTSCSAMLVHLSGGVIETHFHFFIVVPLIALYQDWRPFLIAIAYVVVHHGVIGSVAPQEVYNHPAAIAAPMKWAAIHGSFVLGEAVACIAAWRIMERSRRDFVTAEKEVRALASIVSSHVDPILGCSPEGRIASWNPAATELFGWTQEEAVGRTLPWIFDEIDPGHMDSTLADVAKGNPREHVLTKARSRGGKKIDVALTFSPVVDSLDLGRGCAVFVKDIRHRKKNEEQRRVLEERIRQIQKMEAVGQLAGGIAHDFNNLLSVIQNFTRFVLDDLPPDNESRDDLEEVLAASRRGANLTRQLLTFSRKDVIQPQVVSMNDIIDDLEKLLRRTLGASIELSISGEEDLFTTKADVGQMEQVLLNLAINAKDAMPSGGLLRIETQNVILDDDAPLHPELPPGPYVKVSMSDTGAGIAKEIQNRIFEPFFTTKTKTQGTGLGLATCYGIINQAGGHISVYSELGHGTSFSIYLPAAGLPADDPRLESSPTPTYDGTGRTVLLVEDEEPVRRICKRILERAGYAVVAKASPAEALEATPDKLAIDILVSDVIMPGMSGRELSTRLGIPTIFMSGYTDRIVSREGVIHDGEHFLQKPFTAHDLLHKVADVIDQSEQVH